MVRQSRTGEYPLHLTGLIRQGIRCCVFAMFLIVLLSYGSVYAKTAKQYSPSQASAWIRQQAGKTVNYWNPPSDAQCTELVYYYYRHLDVNAPDTDELCLEARITGIKGVYRNVHLHALNLFYTYYRN